MGTHTDTHTVCLGSLVKRKDASLMAPFKIAEGKKSK